MKCFDCPRDCGIDRSQSFGFCHEHNKIRIAKIIENFMWEEPCISGEKGALAIFFSGCNMKCNFCQNKAISHLGKGEEYSPHEFRKLILSHDLKKFSSIDLVTPTHFSSLLFDALDGIDIPIPIVWNSSGYEKPEMIDKISSFVDVFLPDFKFFNSNLSKDIANAEDYFSVASNAIVAMRKNKPENKLKNGVLETGVLIRHLVLPSHVQDSIKILEFIKSNIDKPCISLMSQFVPLGDKIKRRLYPLEYKAVLSYAEKLGLNEGFIQDFESANQEYIPQF